MLSVNKYNFNTFQTATKLGGAAKPVQKSNVRAVFWHNNDGHGNTDKLSAVMESAKHFDRLHQDTITFKVSGGDNVSGADISKNDVGLDIMDNLMGVEVSTLGNHEVDGGLKALIEIAKKHKMKFVVTNAEFEDESGVEGAIAKSIIIEKGGEKFGFVGAMPIDFKQCTKKSAQEGIEVMDFEDSVEAIQEEVDKLKEQKINKIILLSHSGYDIDKQYATNLDGVDIIVGGHSHSVVQGAVHGENVVKSKSGEPVIIVQAGENGKYYGVLDVEFDQNGKLTKISSNLTEVSGKKNPNIEYIKNQKMGVSPVVGTIKEIDEMPPNRRLAPHAWANLIVDSMRSEFDSDVAFLNAANIRKVPMQGNLTERDITESVPMKNKLIRTHITQKQMVEAIKQASKETLGSSMGEPGLLFASGITYKVSSKGDLLEMNFIDKNGNKNPIDINNPSETITYTAIYDEFTMKADGEYPALAPKFPVEHFEYDKDKTAIDYISKMPNKNDLRLSDDRRLEILKPLQLKPLSSSNQKFLNLTAPKAS